MTQTKLQLHFEFGLTQAGSISALSISPRTRFLLASCQGPIRNRLLLVDSAQSQLMQTDIDTGDRFMSAITWDSENRFFLGNNRGDVYFGTTGKDLCHIDFQLHEILSGLGNGTQIRALAFSPSQQMLAIAINSHIFVYHFNGSEPHEAQHWSLVKALQPFGAEARFTTLKFIGRHVNQLLVGSDKGLCVWLARGPTIRPVFTNYTVPIVDSAVPWDADYLAVTTQDHNIVVWPLTDSRPVAHERFVMGIPGSPSMSEPPSLIAYVAEGTLVTRTLSSDLNITTLYKPRVTVSQPYGAPCEITLLEASDNFMITGGSSPTGRVTISCWSTRDELYASEIGHQETPPVTPLANVLSRRRIGAPDTVPEPAPGVEHKVLHIIASCVLIVGFFYFIPTNIPKVPAPGDPVLIPAVPPTFSGQAYSLLESFVTELSYSLKDLGSAVRLIYYRFLDFVIYWVMGGQFF